MIVLGRSWEQVEVERALDAVLGGPTALVLEGPLGIGKTTVWRWGVDRARQRGYRVLESAPAAPDSGLAFSALGDLLDGVAHDVLPTVPGPQRRSLAAALLLDEPPEHPGNPDALPRAVLQVLRHLSADGPLVVAIDDEQWVDRASARVLGFALCRLRGERVGVVLARRPDADGGLWSELGRGFRGGSVTTVVLPPLENSAIHTLVRAELSHPVSRSVLSRLEEASGGNPLYARAMASELEARQAHLIDDSELPIPRTLADALARRLDRVEPRAHDPLLIAAAASHPSFKILRALVPGFSLTDLESAERAGIVQLSRDRVHFTHPLLASIHYASVPASRRRELHRRLAEVIDDEEERAHHLALGTDDSNPGVASMLERAAEVAAERAAPEVAAELLEHALRLTPTDDVEQRRSRTMAAAAQHHASGLFGRARDLLEELIPDLPRGRMRARALMQLALVIDSDMDAVERVLEEALHDVGDDHRLRARVEQELCALAATRGKISAMAVHAKAAVDAAERTGDGDLRALMLAGYAHAAFWTGESIEQQHLQGAIRLEASMDAPHYELPSTAWARILLLSDDVEAARPLLEHVVSLAREGDQYDLGWDLLYLALLECEAGHLDTAERYVTEAEEAIDEGGYQDAAFLSWVRSLIAGGRGKLVTARALAQQAIASAQSVGYVLGVAWATVALAAVELWAGEAVTAHDRLTPLRESLLADGLGFMGSRTLGLWSYDIEALIASGRADQAEHILRDLLERAEMSENPHAKAIAHRCEALCLAARGDVGAALTTIDLALTHHAQRPVPLEIGWTLLEKGALQRRAKQKTASKQTLEKALAILEPLDAEMLVNRARDELVRVGLRRPTAKEGLTPAQERVAQLVAGGLSNPEIARTLNMSRRSVESHLTKVYREVGVRSRSQLVAALAATGDHRGEHRQLHNAGDHLE